MKKINLSILVIILISCGIKKTKTTGNNIGPKNVEFYVNFINEVPELKVPLELNCGFEKLILTEEQVEKLRPFTPAGYEIIGKLSINPNYNILIIGELIEKRYYPSVFVTDKEGMNQSNQKLFENTCNSDSTIVLKYQISVNSSLQIVVAVSRIDTNFDNILIARLTTIFEINNKGEVKKL